MYKFMKTQPQGIYNNNCAKCTNPFTLETHGTGDLYHNTITTSSFMQLARTSEANANSVCMFVCMSSTDRPSALVYKPFGDPQLVDMCNVYTNPNLIP